MQDYPQIRFTVLPFPLPASMHPWARKAAEYADCVEQQNEDAFWTFTAKIFEMQSNISSDNADEQLKAAATALGVDAEKASTCATLPETEARISKSIDFGKSLDVTQIPTLFVNGRRVVGGSSDLPYQKLSQLVQFEIDHAGR
jgi:protein-disulfide isomerase